MTVMDETMKPKPNLKEYLDPAGVAVLKKRLGTGQITPKIFKETLKRQMVSQFFQEYTHPVERAWEKMVRVLTRERSLIRRRGDTQHGSDGEDTVRIDWGQPFPLPPSKNAS